VEFVESIVMSVDSDMSVEFDVAKAYGEKLYGVITAELTKSNMTP